MTNHRDTLRDHGGRVLPAVEAAWEGIYVTAVLPKGPFMNYRFGRAISG